MDRGEQDLSPGLEGSGSGLTSVEQRRDGRAAAVQPPHWCYQCNKEVAVECAGEEQEMTCVECRSGFVEVMTTAQAVPDVRRTQRRRRHHAGGGEGNIRPRNVSLSEALEQLYPQQLMQVLQLLGQATNHTSTQPPSPVQSNEQVPVQVQRGGALQRLTEVALQGAGFELTVEDEGEPAPGPFPGTHGNDGVDEGDGGREQEEPQLRAASRPLVAAFGVGDESITDPLSFLVREQAAQDRRGEDDSDSDSEAEAAMRLELDGWDSLDEDEWEEVDDDAADTAENFQTALDNGTENLRPEGEHVRPARQGAWAHGRARELHTLHVRTRSIENTLHQYLRDLLQNLIGRNIEVRVEIPQAGYVGNPGDYVDARGFEQLLQQMAENDNSRRGAPPASKSAIEALPTVVIQQEQLDDGTALCAICKDVVALGEPAKQLPCLHLYHYDCIMPWLSSRNSCPVCRYELPTDDPDYEQQRQSGYGRHNTSSQNGSLTNRESEAPSTTEQQHGASNAQDMAEVDSLESSDDSGSREASDSEPSDYVDAEGPGQNNDANPDHRDSRGHGSTRGWLLLGAGPVLSMMGVMLVFCLRNHLMSGSLNLRGNHHQLQRQARAFQEPRLEQLAAGPQAQARSRWWMPFQR